MQAQDKKKGMCNVHLSQRCIKVGRLMLMQNAGSETGSVPEAPPVQLHKVISRVVGGQLVVVGQQVQLQLCLVQMRSLMKQWMEQRMRKRVP